MKRRENFTAYEILPEDLAIYLSHNGPHFNKLAVEFAISQMYRTEGEREVPVKMMPKSEVDNFLAVHGIKLKNGQLYDAVYVATMVKADYYGSSITTDAQLARYIKDTLDDPDGIEGLTFNRWIADMKWLGIAIPWDEFL